MVTPRSVRLSDDVLTRLNALALRRGTSVASLMERFIDEALRRETHPGVTFRDGPSGRRAGLVAGPDVDEVIRGLHDIQAEGGGEDPDGLLSDVADSLSLEIGQVRDAVAYYADHRDEIDDRIELKQAAADELEQAWRRQQEVLSGHAR